MAATVKTVNGLALASVKTYDGLAIASVKTINGMDAQSGGGGYTPPASTIAWYKADAITGLSDGDPVGTWNDSSGSGNSISQTGSARPTYKTSIINSLPVVRFDGSDDKLLSSPFSSAISQPNTIVIVTKSIGAGAYAYDGLSSGNRHLLDMNGVSSQAGAFAGGFYNSDGGTLTPTNVNLITIIYNGASTQIRINGVLASGSGDCSTNPMDGLTMGATYDGAYGNLDIAELLICSDGLSGGDITSVESYLMTKYAI